MTYAIWIVLEDEETGDKRWWSVDHHHDQKMAEDQVEEIADMIGDRTGLYPSELDG